jgi:hypothetical protein
MTYLSEVHDQMIIRCGRVRKVATESGELFSSQVMLQLWQAIAAMEKDMEKYLKSSSKE